MVGKFKQNVRSMTLRLLALLAGLAGMRLVQPGYVYVLHLANDIYEIGSVESPEDILSLYGDEIVHLIPTEDMTLGEIFLTGVLDERHLAKKQFRLSAEDLAWVKSLESLKLQGGGS